MTQPFTQVDAFTDTAFSGNAAAVCILDSPRDEPWMQAVAREMNLADTAFLIPTPNTDSDFQLCWFTPSAEVDLCGHATLASAHVLFEDGRLPRSQTVRFSTRSGVLSARTQDGSLVLDFPVGAPEAAECPNGLVAALGTEPVWVGRGGGFYLAELSSESVLRQLEPDLVCIKTLPEHGLIVTARSESERFDFVSRVFAPAVGIPEDPVTGSAHCVLAPFWSDRLRKAEMTGYQASPRGGVVGVELNQDRVKLKGKAVTVIRGEILC